MPGSAGLTPRRTCWEAGWVGGGGGGWDRGLGAGWERDGTGWGWMRLGSGPALVALYLQRCSSPAPPKVFICMEHICVMGVDLRP